MQQQLGASPFLLLVCEERTRGCDCSASAHPKECQDSWSRVSGQEEAAPGPAQLSIPPLLLHTAELPPAAGLAPGRVEGADFKSHHWAVLLGMGKYEGP